MARLLNVSIKKKVKSKKQKVCFDEGKSEKPKAKSFTLFWKNWCFSSNC